MKFEYTPETDTLYIEFKQTKDVEGENINNRTVGYYSQDNELTAIEIEHAKKAVNLKKIEINGKVIVARKMIPTISAKRVVKKKSLA